MDSPQPVKAALPQAKGGPDEERIPMQLTVAPGRTITARMPRSAIGRTGIVTIVLDPDTGAPSIIWESWATLIRMTDDFAERTGLPVSRQTVHAFLLAGFVEGWCAGPNNTWVCLTSLRRFMDKIRVEVAREFWTEENLRKYTEAYAEVRTQGLRNRLPHAGSGSQCEKSVPGKVVADQYLFPFLDSENPDASDAA